ncbi:MAG: hypothetical protein ACYC35_10715 [Pirellulales bacterium]
MNLFSIICTTCHARLNVRDPAAIGQILACPRCSSMVLVEAPADWKPEPGDSPASAAGEAASLTDAQLDPTDIVAQPAPWLGALRQLLDAAPPWQKWSLMAGVPAFGLAMVLGLWAIFSHGEDAAPAAVTAMAGNSTAQKISPSPAANSAAKPATEQAPPNPPAGASAKPLPPPSSAKPPAKKPAAESKPKPSGVQPATTAQKPAPAAPPESPAKKSPEKDPGSAKPRVAIGDDPSDPLLALDPGPSAGPLQPLPAKAPAAASPSPADKSPAKKPEPNRVTSEVNVQARLADKIAAIDFAGVSAADFVRFLSELSTLRITLDLDAMSAAGLGPGDPMTVRLSDTTVGGALESALTPYGLAAVIRGNQLQITRVEAAPSSLRRVRYTVSDLASDNPAAVGDLAAMACRLIAPESWQENGGPGTIEVADGAWIVTQTSTVHQQLLTLCEKLRTARGKPLRSRLDPARFRLETRSARAAAALRAPVTAHFDRATPLEHLAAHLETVAQVRILVNWVALDEAGIPSDVEGTLSVEKLALAQALKMLLDPLELTCRIVDEKTLEITTPQASAARCELEFYPAASLLAGGATAQNVSERIKGQLPGAKWAGAGGRGSLAFDSPSGCLLVWQTQAVQIQLGAILQKMDERTAAERPKRE